ncbi:FAD-dependent oxidoreductase, partial [Candidatus Babeliales bacterium]|nr:FAD-dependent oxidoreductase [Candidatus Babeliales bacterium]
MAVNFKLIGTTLVLAVGAFIGRGWRKEKVSAMGLSAKDIVIDKDTYSGVIIGGGPAGLTSAIYLAQAQYKPLLVEGKTPGGALTQSHAVHNWPGEKNISGAKLMEQIRDHALHTGAKIESEEVVSVDFSAWPYKLTVKSILSGKERGIKALACIVATGSIPNFLGVPGERGDDGYFGRGVSTCAVCDGIFYRGKIVAIVGGGDSAIVEAGYLSSLAKEVHILVRKEAFRAANGVKDRVLTLPNVKVHFNTEVQEIVGDGKKVTHAKIVNNKTNEESDLPIDGLFLAIGSHPNTAFFAGQIECDQNGYIILKKDQQTSKDGVFAAGDVADPIYKQAITSAGDGCRAALQAMEFLQKVGFVQEKGNLVPEDEKTIKAEDKTETVIVNPPVAEKKIPQEEPEQKLVMAKDTDGTVITISSSDQLEKALKESGRPAVVDFYATWCMPCKMMHPIYEALAKTFS